MNCHGLQTYQCRKCQWDMTFSNGVWSCQRCRLKVVDFLTKDKWIKGHMARDRQGKPVGTGDSEACHFDVLGAINICYKPEERLAIMERIVVHLPTGNKLICLWNDSVEWEEIEETLRKAGV